jgi:hypothetical protein
MVLKGFNLVGNPYPSTIDWGATSGWIRSNLGTSGGGYDMWIWSPSANNYGVYNSADVSGVGTNSVTRYISSMQGYFVQASTAGNMITNNNVRAFNVSGNWLKSAKQELDKVSLSVTSDAGYGSDEIHLKFGYAANENGATKLFSKVQSAPSIYMVSKGNYLSVIYLTNTEENPAVPLMFASGLDGNYTIHCSFDQSKFETVMLQDMLTRNIQNMKGEQTYRFKASKTDATNRFALYFGPISDLLDEEFPARIYTDGVHLIIDLTLVSENTNVFIYDLTGRLLLERKLPGKSQHTLNFSANTQMLIVYLKNPRGSLCRKLLWVK